MSAISISWPTAARYRMPCGSSATNSHGKAKLRTWARHCTEAQRRLEVTNVEPLWMRLARRDAPLIMKCKTRQTAATAAGTDATVTNRVPSR